MSFFPVLGPKSHIPSRSRWNLAGQGGVSLCKISPQLVKMSCRWCGVFTVLAITTLPGDSITLSEIILLRYHFVITLSAITQAWSFVYIIQWLLSAALTRKPSCRWQTRVTRKHAKIAPIRRSTCLQQCRWQYWSIFIRLAVGPSEICEILQNYPKIQTYRVQGHPRSSILVPIESPYVTCY